MHQRLPSATTTPPARAPLPPEAEGYTMMYEPPLPLPSKPVSTDLAGQRPHGEAAEGASASASLAPLPPVPTIQLDEPQQDDVFRASEVIPKHDCYSFSAYITYLYINK
jgi:hypothetical protein